ncbi:hypothetical protein HMPREF0083_01085 [Aneurinibacillus aneurinilyticus ATCC 12856]|uniref:Uncharacterized protein n=2 Tax=Aneurinibacillus aneurinilyticus TaxID=1391 RepID=U1WQG5_ANEAE|nr:hypothetical protein HMPREF0083_01085 [Aneurinibacillus aneurinilyticus ATCC 12856]
MINLGKGARKMKARMAAIDAGNDGFKCLFSGLNKENEVYIPNVIAKANETRDIVELEKKVLDGLHVEVTSSALEQGRGIYVVGKLAARNQDSDELTADKNKSENDQTLIVFLTALAFDGVQHFEEKDGIIDATYVISTGLPLEEVKKKKKRTFKEKLIKSTHEVKFRDTPYVGGKTVRIKIVDALVNTEGHAAMFDLTTNDDGSIKNEELTKVTFLINDIGGLSTDLAIIDESGNIDNDHSDGIKEGVSPYLDEIIRRVYSEYGYRFKSRRELVNIITDDSEDKNHIYVIGTKTPIKKFVDEELMKLARKEYSLIKNMWAKVPSIRLSYQIGGGALILKEYMEKLNEQDKNFPLRFVGKKDSVWMIARAYFKLLRIYVKRKGIDVENSIKVE